MPCRAALAPIKRAAARVCKVCRCGRVSLCRFDVLLHPRDFILRALERCIAHKEAKGRLWIARNLIENLRKLLRIARLLAAIYRAAFLKRLAPRVIGCRFELALDHARAQKLGAKACGHHIDGVDSILAHIEQQPLAKRAYREFAYAIGRGIVAHAEAANRAKVEDARPDVCCAAALALRLGAQDFQRMLCDKEWREYVDLELLAQLPFADFFDKAQKPVTCIIHDIIESAKFLLHRGEILRNLRAHLAIKAQLQRQEIFAFFAELILEVCELARCRRDFVAFC